MLFTHIIQYIQRRLYLLMWTTDPTGVKFILASGSILWGLMLLWPGATFDRPAYDLMSRFASENSWGLTFLAQGMYSMYNLLFGESKSKACLLLDGILGSVLWLGSCVCILMSMYPPPPAAISGEITLALASWWNLVVFNLKKRSE